MKNIYTLKIFVFTLFLGLLNAQIPTNYYSTANGLTGYPLKNELGKIIDNAKDNGYAGLWDTYKTTDLDKYYERDNTLMDIYSEIPTRPDYKEFTLGADQCGDYTGEGDCYNREHTVPQSFFGIQNPMYGDAHFVVPTDGHVNNQRGDYGFGEVGTIKYISKNGSKLGTNTSPGFAGTVFEPIDEFKGDVARMVLYFVTRYGNKISTFPKMGDMLEASPAGLQKWELDMLLKWSLQDPVSQREVDRNNAVYAKQSNRNPYIDHPEWVGQVWGTAVADTEAPTTPANIVLVTAQPRQLQISWAASTDNIKVTGYKIFVNGEFFMASAAATARLINLTPSTSYNITVQAYDAAGNLSPMSSSNVITTDIPDTIPPTSPTNIAVSNITKSSATINWAAATDNVEVRGYNVYLNGTLAKTVAITNTFVTDLNPGTAYALTVEAFDEAGNISTRSAATNFTTVAGPPSCGKEDFTNLGKGPATYTTVTWIGLNKVDWKATGARNDTKIKSSTDPTIDGLPAIVVKNGSLSTTTVINGGMSSFTVSVGLPFKDLDGDLTLKVNGNAAGTIPYTSDGKTIIITLQNPITDPITSIELVNNTASRVAIANLSWTCASNLGTSETQKQNAYSIYPNPVRNNDLYVLGDNLSKIEKADIYSITGQLVQSVAQPFKNGNKINLKSLPKGVYILKTSAFTSEFIVE